MLKHQGNMKWYSIYNDDPVQQHVLMNTPHGYECVRVRMISTWFILINLVCLCLPEVLLSARASPSPNKVQGCNASACFHASICLWKEFVQFVIMSEIKYLHWPRLTGSVKKDERFLPKRSSFFIYFFIFYSSFIFFFLQTAQSRWMRYIATQLQGVATLWGTNKTLKKK